MASDSPKGSVMVEAETPTTRQNLPVPSTSVPSTSVPSTSSMQLQKSRERKRPRPRPSSPPSPSRDSQPSPAHQLVILDKERNELLRVQGQVLERIAASLDRMANNMSNNMSRSSNI